MNPQPIGPAPGDSAVESVAFIQSEIRRWQQEGLIPARLARRLLSRYEPGRDPAAARAFVPETDWPDVQVPLHAGMVLLYLGGLLILTAALMLLADLWGDLGPGGRCALVGLPMLLLYGLGAALFRPVSAARLTGIVMLFFACLLVPFALWLGSVWVWGGPVGDREVNQRIMAVAGTSLAIHLGTLWRFRSPVLSIPYPLSFLATASAAGALWATAGPTFPQSVAVALCGAGLVLLAAGAWASERGHAAYAATPNLAGIYSALFALFMLSTNRDQIGWQIVSVLAALGALAASVWRRNQAFLFAGALFLMINIFHLGFTYFQDTAGLLVTLVLCGALSMAVGYAVQRMRKEYLAPDR